MTKTEIQNWLDSGDKRRTRKWLAAQVGVSAGTVDGWLSSGRPIPAPAQKLIARLMAPEEIFVVEFDPAVVDTIKRAATLQAMEWRDWSQKIAYDTAVQLLRIPPHGDPFTSEAPARTAGRAARKGRRPGTASAII